MLITLALAPIADQPLFLARDLEVGGETIATKCGTPAKDYILEVNGAGLVSADFNLDGHLDLDLDLVVVDGSTIERVRASGRGSPRASCWRTARAGFVRPAPSGRCRAAAGAWEAAPGMWTVTATRTSS